MQTIFRDAITWACERYQSREEREGRNEGTQHSQSPPSCSRSDSQTESGVLTRSLKGSSHGVETDTANCTGRDTQQPYSRIDPRLCAPDLDSGTSGNLTSDAFSARTSQRASDFELGLPSLHSRPNQTCDSPSTQFCRQVSDPSVDSVWLPPGIDELPAGMPSDLELNGFDWGSLAFDLEVHPPGCPVPNAELSV